VSADLPLRAVEIDGQPFVAVRRMTVWLTLAEAAEHIRAKSDRLIRNAIKAGELPACTYGKSEIRIDAEDLDEWLRARPWEPAS
jgi:excisionase family DNA binding protein